jgi:hypothetical protein
VLITDIFHPGVLVTRSSSEGIFALSSEMDIVIPLCGKGERFSNEGYTKPKPFISVCGKPILQHAIHRLRLQPEDTVWIFGRPSMEPLFEALEWSPQVHWLSVAEETRGAAETLAFGLQELQSRCLHRHEDERGERPLLILDGDAFYRIDVVGLFRSLAVSAVAVFSVTPDDPPIFSYAWVDDENHVRAIAEKNPISNWANTGAYYFPSRNLDYKRTFIPMIPSPSSNPSPCCRHKLLRVVQLSSIIVVAVIYLGVFSPLLRRSYLVINANEEAQYRSHKALLFSATTMLTNDSIHSPMELLLTTVGDTKNLSTVLDSCKPTAEISLSILTTTGSSSLPWKLVTFSFGGLDKNMGGDEFYAVYVGPNDISDRLPENATSLPTAVARLTDTDDGTYNLHFVAAPRFGVPTNATMLAAALGAASDNGGEAGGKLYIVLQYTCRMGSLPQPAKDSWSSCGALNRVYQVSLPFAPPISRLEAPTIIYPESLKTSSYSSGTLRGYDRVFGFGDSLIRQFFEKRSVHRYYEPNMNLLKNIGAPLDSATVERQFLMKLRPHLILIAQEAGIRKNSTDALVIGSGVWDVLSQKVVQGRDFQDHLRAAALFVETLKKEFPGLQLYWKSMTALQVHQLLNVKDGTHIGRVYYLSESRSKKLYELQLELMKQLEVPVLDMYPLSYVSADMLMPGDGRHFKEAFSEAYVKLFFTRK